MEKPKPNVFAHMTWAGAQIIGNDWSVYTGTSIALSSGLHENGWRMRLISGHSSYSYNGTATIQGQSTPVTYRGTSSFGNMLLGYRWQQSDLILKVFAGLSAIGHSVEPTDPNNAAIGTRYGGSAALETWFNLSGRQWLSADATYATVFNSFNATVTSGYRIWQKFSLGLSAGVTGNDDYEAVRGAGVAAAEFGLLQQNDSYLRISAGVSADRDMDLTPYASVSFAFKY